MAKPKSPTVKQLKQSVRQVVLELSERYAEYMKKITDKSDREVIERRVANMQKIYGKGRKGLFSLRFRTATKAELQTQLQQYKSFSTFVKQTYERKTEDARKLREQYESFSRNYGKGLSLDEYKDLANIFGAIGDKMLNQFGSKEVIELYRNMDRSKRYDLVNEMREVYKNARGKGYTAEQLVDLLYERIEDSEK